MKEVKCSKCLEELEVKRANDGSVTVEPCASCSLQDYRPEELPVTKLKKAAKIVPFLQVKSSEDSLGETDK